MATKTKATVEDVLRLGAAGERYELVDGELVAMRPTGFEHGNVESWTGSVFTGFVVPRRLGRVLVGEPLFRLDRARGIGRAPDIAFVRRERLIGCDLTGAFDGAPDLAVEIVSPNDSAKDVQEKVDQWLAYETGAVLLMYPATKRVILWRGDGAHRFSRDDELDLDPALPGFRCKVSELFPPPLEDEAQ